MEEWACPLCSRRRGGLRTAAMRSAPTKFEPEAAADAQTPQDEGHAGEARGRLADADALTEAPSTGLKLRLPAAKEVTTRILPSYMVTL